MQKKLFEVALQHSPSEEFGNFTGKDQWQRLANFQQSTLINTMELQVLT